MKTKNHIKSSGNTIRGIGKLGYTESGKMNSTLKRLIASNDEVTSHNSGKNKLDIVCPYCKKKFKTNNPNIIPDHKDKSYNSYFSKIMGGVCQGSTSMEITPEYFRSIEKFETWINYTRVNVGDIVLIDFSLLKGFNKTDIFKTKITATYRHIFVRKNGNASEKYNDFIEVDGITEPISVYSLNKYNFLKTI